MGPVDVLGRAFAEGQVITFPYRRSSYLTIRTAVVRKVLGGALEVEVFEVDYRWRSGYEVRSYTTTIERTDRATVTDLVERELRALLQAEANGKNALRPS